VGKECCQLKKVKETTVGISMALRAICRAEGRNLVSQFQILELGFH
jgi:hypothetical protein